MVSDEHYEACLPILQDSGLEDEDKTDKLEELLKKETTLTGSSLDNAILDVLWRYREGGVSSASPPPIRQTILRRPSPASWRTSTTPLSGSPRLGVSPLAPPGYVPSTLNRTKSSTASPFGSPRPSPRLNFATPVIPHSPNLNAYEFANDPTPAHEILGDYPAENVEWLVSDDNVSLASSAATAPSVLNPAAPEFSFSAAGATSAPHQTDMTPYDMLRTILGHSRTDEDIEAALASHGYDLSATVASIMDGQARALGGVVAGAADEPKKVFVGRTAALGPRPTTPVNQGQKPGIICKFYLSNGQCLRSDCRFSHDLSNHLCKYWVMGNCLAGDTCVFSHDPAHLANKLTLDGSSTPPPKAATLHVQDYGAFPSLHDPTADVFAPYPGNPVFGITQSPGLRPFHPGDNRPRSRPGSRHQTPGKDQAPALDDTEAFPSLGAGKPGKKHHGKRGGHGPKEPFVPSSLADIVKMAPSPSQSPRADKKIGRNGSTASRNGENSLAAQAIPSPKHVPWLETGERANKAYLKARQEAIKHGGLRNKFLQSAAQAWNRNDARAAKALSLRGQSENDLMRKAHREAARELYEERNRAAAANSQAAGGAAEIYVDLHGLHPEEAVEYLERSLMENEAEARPVYAITGTGHHSKNGKDKVGKAVRNFLNEWRYAFREFSVPGDRNSMGGILGIDARSWDKSLARGGGGTNPDAAAAGSADGEKGGVSVNVSGGDLLSQGVEIGEGKVKLLVRDPPKGPSAGRRS